MSSSAFFIEAAANTVRLLSCASAGEVADPARIAKAAKSPARRCTVALRACSHALSARANQALVMVECDRRKRRSVNPADLRSVRTSQLELTALLRRSKGFALLAVIAWGPARPIHCGRRPAFAPGSSAVSASAVFSAASDGAPN